MTFKKLLEDKNKRLNDVPLSLQNTVVNQQKKVLSQIIKELNKLDSVNGEIKINSKNLKAIVKISDEMKSIFLNDEYLKAVKGFAKEFETQAGINSKLFKAGFGETATPIAAKSYIDIAKKSAINSLAGEPYKTIAITPIEEILQGAVVNGAKLEDTIASITAFLEGSASQASGILKYVKQITNDSFAIADRSYTSIVSDVLGNDWFYFAGSEVDNTRCFCKERVGNFYHYKEIESWGKGENLGACNIGGGKWAGEIYETNEFTIYSYLGGFNCMHSLMPVSEAIVAESDINRSKKLGYV